MGLLKRLRRRPGDEDEDEFDAEESGLLMVSSPPSNAEKAAREEESASPPAQEEAQASQPEAAEPSPGGGDPLDLTPASPPVQSQAQPAVAQEAPAQESSFGDSLSLFKASVSEQTSLLPVLKDTLEDIAAADLLADARSVRDRLLGRVPTVGGEQQGQETS